jgi:imidazolonepropionase-like amidohydrolase
MNQIVWGCLALPAFAAPAWATRVSGEAAGAGDRVGTVEPGKRANLVVLGADPTTNISNTTSIRFVIKAGRLVVRQ